MNQIKSDNLLIIKLDNKTISEEFISSVKNKSIPIVNFENMIRCEHPHCAFFKTTHPVGDEVLQRTVLYTPEGRLYQDFNKSDEGVLVPLDRFIKKSPQLDTFLFYLRDLEILENDYTHIEDAKVLQMPKSPLNALMAWTEDDVFEEIIKEYEIVTVHVLSALSKLYNSKIQILIEKLRNKIDYLVFDVKEDIEIDEQLFDKWHSHYIRKAKLFK